MRVYICGPMRGHENWNFAAFDAAEARWQAAGHQVFSPAAIARAMHYLQDESRVDRTHLLHVIQSDLACLYAADALALLPGWEESTGAAVECALAQFLGLPIYDAETMERIDPPRRPWRFAKPLVAQLGDEEDADWYSSRSAIWAAKYKERQDERRVTAS